jgi:uncharacterized RDD family membrane protein YckC
MVPEEAPRPHEATDFPATGINSLASFTQRGTARGIDAMVPLVPVLAILMTLALRDGSSTAALPRWPVFVGIAIAVVYETAFVAWRGQTPGKMLLGVRVARLVDGTTPDRAQSALRSLVPASALSLPGALGIGLYLFVLLMAVPSELRRGIHDQAGGTVVVRSR